MSAESQGFQVPTSLLDSLKASSGQESTPQDTQEQVSEEVNENPPTEIDAQEATNQEQESSEEGQTEESQSQEAAPAVEELVITGPNGQKQKIQVDWNDKEKLKKYIHAAAGMRKFQAERDNALKELKAFKEQSTDVEQSWNAVKGAFEQEGLKGIINLFTNRPDGYDLFLKQELYKQQRKAEASPEELKQIELEEKLEREQKAREQLEKKVQQTLEQSTKEKEAATVAELQSRINPVFDRYRFAGRLGDEAAEQVLDTALWNQTKERLAQYPDDMEVTPQLIDKEFRAVASTLRKVIQKQAEKKTEQVIQTKKTQAATKAAAMATKGYQPGNQKDSIRKSVENNDMLGALKQFFGNK